MEYNLKADERATLELRGLYEKYGYRKYKMGKFEEYSLYVNNREFLTGDKVLTFTDLDGRLLAMKPDVTLSVINNTDAGDDRMEKLYYIENVYRENKESHCFKEISQMGLELLGSVDRYSILEVITLAARSLENISSDYLLEISHMHYTLNLLDSLDLSESAYMDMLGNIRQKNVTGIKEGALAADLSDRMTDLLCRIPFLYGDMDSVIERARNMAVNEKMQKNIDELERYTEALKERGLAEKIQIDLSLINDIDYYNGMIFRGYIRSLPGCILAGGQYDKAMTRLGKKGKAVGFAIYLDELTRGDRKPAEYDVDAVLIYADQDRAKDISAALEEIQKENISVRAVRNGDGGLRYRNRYVMKDGAAVKEEI